MEEYSLIRARVQSFSTHEQRANGEKSGLDGVFIIMGWEINLCIRFSCEQHSSPVIYDCDMVLLEIKLSSDQKSTEKFNSWWYKRLMVDAMESDFWKNFHFSSNIFETQNTDR